MVFTASWHSFIKGQRYLRITGMLSSFLLFLVVFLFVCPIVLRLSQAEATVGTATASTLALNVVSDTAGLDIAIDSRAGTFATSPSNSLASFTVTTDNATGYEVQLVGQDNSRQLVNAAASDVLDPIGATPITAATFNSSTYLGKWGYVPSVYYNTTSGENVVNTGANALYFQAPDTNADIIAHTTSANVTADTYTIGLGAMVSYAKPSGVYENTYTLMAVGNLVLYSISYNDNTSDSTVQNLPSDTAGSTLAETLNSVNLANSVPTRTGYTFNKWCLGTVHHVNYGNSTCDGTEYAMNASFGIDQTTDNTDIKLYAMWNVNSYNVTVNFAGTGVSSVVFAATGQTTRTVSSSGGTASLTYGVRYSVTMNFVETTDVFDSWSLNNANYGTLSSTTVNPTYFTPNALSSSAVITATGRSTIIRMQDFTKSVCETQASSASVTVRDTRDGKDYAVRYINGECWMVENLRYLGDTGSSSSSMIVDSDTTNVDADKTISYGDLTSGNSRTVARIHDSGNTTNGVWYNYCAASAGTICSSSNSSSATYDLCPKGWKLPTKTQSDGLASYKTAFFNDGSAVTGGWYNAGSRADTGRGLWWTATHRSSSTTDMQSFVYMSSNLSSYYNNRYGGLYVRCVRSS